MATRPPNSSSSSGRIAPKKVRLKPVAKGGKPQKTTGAKSYSWGKGQKATHTIPLSAHRKNSAALQKKREVEAQKKADAELSKQVDALSQLRYGGQQAALNTQGRAIPSFFNQYQQRLQQSTAAAQGYYAGLQAQGQAMQQQAAQGPNLGPGVSADVQAQAQLAGASRAGMAGQFNQALGANAGAENAFLQNQGAVAGAAQLGQQLQNSNQQVQLRNDIGAYKTTARSDIQSAQASAAQKQQENDLAAQALGLKGQAEQNDLTIAKTKIKETAKQRRAKVRTEKLKIRSAARQARIAAKREGQTPNEWGYSKDQWKRFSPSHRQRIMKAMAKAPGGGGGSGGSKTVSQTQAREGRITFRKAVANVERHKSVESKALYQALVDAGYDPTLARGAVQLVRKGNVGPKTKQQLRDDYGVTVTTQKRRPQKRYTPSQPVSERTYG
jgi:hypothetical protein